MNTPIDTIIQEEDLTSLVGYVSSITRPLSEEDYVRLENCVIKDWVSGFQVYSSVFPPFDREQIDIYVDMSWEYNSPGIFLYFLHSIEGYDWTAFLLSRKHLEQHIVISSALLNFLTLTDDQIQLLRARLPEDSARAEAVSALLEISREQQPLAQEY
jgi:hypothetical protein